MIYNIGVDIVRIDRFQRWLDNHGLIHRFFSVDEGDYLIHRAQAQSLAGHFAAKEAFAKATRRGLRRLRLKDIEVKYEKNGGPYLTLTGLAHECIKELAVKKTCLSLSHDTEYAIAFVVLEY